MRTIIFRAWDRTSNKEGKMVLWEELKKYKCEDVFLPCEIEMAEVTLMQFTGLKDKNGVEIYEGDICDFKTVALFESKKDVVNYFRGGYQIGEYYMSYINHLTIRVIGNIHQNPELLK